MTPVRPACAQSSCGCSAATAAGASTSAVRDERFKTTKRCDPGKYYFYKIGDQPNWEYLLPARLLAGTYYLIVTATDRNGFRNSQARKFTVK